MPCVLKDFHADATQNGAEDFQILANWKEGESHPRSATWSCTGKDECYSLLDRLNEQARAVDSLDALERATGKRASSADGKPR